MPAAQRGSPQHEAFGVHIGLGEGAGDRRADVGDVPADIHQLPWLHLADTEVAVIEGHRETHTTQAANGGFRSRPVRSGR
ncbi:hypothetical protein, partial [Nocardia abscessus]|uniref:hypothetical protein n=1 Tax=Nocardia abscessus TaxID=120957 RepID=UPI001C3F4BE1